MKKVYHNPQRQWQVSVTSNDHTPPLTASSVVSFTKSAACSRCVNRGLPTRIFMDHLRPEHSATASRLLLPDHQSCQRTRRSGLSRRRTIDRRRFALLVIIYDITFSCSSVCAKIETSFQNPARRVPIRHAFDGGKSTFPTAIIC